MNQVQRIEQAIQKRIASAQNDQVLITPLNLESHKFPQNIALFDVKFPEDPFSHVVTVSNKIECDCMDAKIASFSPVELKCKHKLAVLFNKFNVDPSSEIIASKYCTKSQVEELQSSFYQLKEQTKDDQHPSKKRKRQDDDNDNDDDQDNKQNQQ